MMSLAFGLFTQVSGSGPLGPLVFSSHRLVMLYTFTKLCESILKASWVTDPNSRVDARLVVDVDGRMNERTVERTDEKLDDGDNTWNFTHTLYTMAVLYCTRLI